MSNNHIAMTAGHPAAETARTTLAPRPSFWRRLFDAWVSAHAKRVDANGNIAFEH